jgi:hypothetical protein
LVGLSDIGAWAVGADFAADFAAGRRDAEAGAELVGGFDVPSSCAADWAGGGGGDEAGGGSAFMMLTGGIDCEDGNDTFGPGGLTTVVAGAGPDGLLDASGRVRVGQLLA